MAKKITLKLLGRDSWDRPVYEDESGKLWKDVTPRADYPADLCSSVNNSFDGEPDTPMSAMKCYQDAEIVFIPKRDTWW
ncbi:MAG: hypothetical protein NC305_18840 [Lachnospiraceae bacterium]|nr:hypothetical protein [Lachnospiraceae bacterium]